MTLITHTAGWIIIDPWTIFQDGFIQVESGYIKAFGTGRAPSEYGRRIDHGPGALMPGLVNAHTHLELTALKNKTNAGGNFMEWVQSVIAQRDFIGNDGLLTKAGEGISEILETGTLFIGEISSLGITQQLFLNSEIKGVWFDEMIGSHDGMNKCVHIAPFKKISISGHAPHTTAPSLLSRAKQKTREHGLVFSIHLAESNEELEFLATGKGPWSDFLTDRGINVNQWRLPAASPVQYADQLGILDEKTIAVHLLHVSAGELELLSGKGVIACVCPRSNLKLHGRLPDVYRMVHTEMRLCLGTDSLASNDSLSMLDEMKFFAERFPEISPEKILAMATVNGSAALGLDHVSGNLHIGKKATFIYAPVVSPNRHTLLEKLVHQDFKEKVKRVHHDSI